MFHGVISKAVEFLTDSLSAQPYTTNERVRNSTLPTSQKVREISSSFVKLALQRNLNVSRGLLLNLQPKGTKITIIPLKKFRPFCFLKKELQSIDATVKHQNLTPIILCVLCKRNLFSSWIKNSSNSRIVCSLW